MSETYVDCDGSMAKGWCVVYLDVLVVFSKDGPSHIRRLERLFDVLSRENLHLSVEKSVVMARYTTYLGIVLG
eukprot:SAG22_NODE_14717_length_367_cov_0.470149_1_plen_72_part_01